MPARLADERDLEPGDRDGGHLEVVDVDAGGVAADHHGPLEGPGRPAGVARGGDGGALLEGRAHAMTSRTASSGLMSTLARPRTPSRPNRERAPRDSQTIDELTMAPASTVLNG